MQTEEIIVVAGRRYRPRKSTAQWIRKSEKTLVRWEQDHKGPPVTRIGRTAYYEESSLEKWIRAQEQTTAAA
jgi:hypothetical protein